MYYYLRGLQGLVCTGKLTLCMTLTFASHYFNCLQAVLVVREAQAVQEDPMVQVHTHRRFKLSHFAN